jgi:membrane dipeptidase
MIHWDAHMCLPLHPQASFAPIEQLKAAGLNYVSIHVGIGLDIGFSEAALDDTPSGDFNPEYWWPTSAGYRAGISDIVYTPVQTWSQLAAALQATGMQPQEVAMVLGGNMLRVAEQVW